jgi:hypothetical protein
MTNKKCNKNLPVKKVLSLAIFKKWSQKQKLA